VQVQEKEELCTVVVYLAMRKLRTLSAPASIVRRFQISKIIDAVAVMIRDP
jgi:hypothetical protein